MSTTKPYRLLPAAGNNVAGERIRDPEILAGRAPLMLSEARAEHPLRQGVIEPFGEDAAKKGKK